MTATAMRRNAIRIATRVVMRTAPAPMLAVMFVTTTVTTMIIAATGIPAITATESLKPG